MVQRDKNAYDVFPRLPYMYHQLALIKMWLCPTSHQSKAIYIVTLNVKALNCAQLAQDVKATSTVVNGCQCDVAWMLCAGYDLFHHGADLGVTKVQWANNVNLTQLVDVLCQWGGPIDDHGYSEFMLMILLTALITQIILLGVPTYLSLI